jgi:aconitate decarboxylase
VSLARSFAEHLLARAAAGLDAAAESSALRLVRDGLAVAALGSIEGGPRILAGMARETAPASGGATLIGHGGRVAPAEAARGNGAAMHVLDFEPMWNPANHSLSTTLPAVLALAQAGLVPARDEPLGSRLLLALALGVEAQERLRLASGQFEPGELVFHPPGAVGALGAATACGWLLGLDAAGLTHALGIAASRAGGLQGNIGSMVKALHCGQAAAAGLESAVMAARGFTADADALGGPRGYGRAFFGESFRPEELTRERAAWQIAEPGPAYKLYPSQYGTHFVIDAALRARAELPEDARPARVRIIGPPMPYVDRPDPPTGLAGKFSFQYVAAVALLDGEVTVASFSDARRFAPDIVALLPNIEIAPDPAREGRFDRMRVDVEVSTSGGAQARATCDGPPGIWGRPVGEERLEAKARDCLAAALGPVRADDVLGRLARFSEIDTGGLADLMQGLSAGADRAAAA